MKTDTLEKIKISPYSKIKVYWDDQPHNYSKEAKTKVRNYFAKKYGVNKNNITAIYRPVKITDKGETIEITGASLENIMDVNYQRALMKELLSRDNKVIDFELLVKTQEYKNKELSRFESRFTEQYYFSLKGINQSYSIKGFLDFDPELERVLF